jgi:branched-chain amino acid transport system substrate-binding protein
MTMSKRPVGAVFDRRRFLKTAGLAAGAAAAGSPRVLRAQPRSIKIGAIHPVTGGLAEIGQACRLGAQMAADAVNAAGGVKSMGGARIEILAGDSQSQPDVARTEAERLINAGAVILTGAFHSQHTAAIVPVAQQKRVPFLIDISAADPITLNVAKSVKEGQQKVQYVYRNFVTTALFGKKAVQFMSELFADAKVAPKRVVLMYSNDLFGQTQGRQFQAAVDAMKPPFSIVETIPFPENTTDLSTEVAKAKSAKPDIIAPVVRPTSAILLLQEIARQRLELMGVVSPGTPGLYEKGQIDQLKELIENVLDNVPWPNFKNPRTVKIAEAYARRSGGKSFDTNSGYSYEAITIIADVLERARTTDADPVVDAIKKTQLADPIMVSAGPVMFNDVGDNGNASTAMIQIREQKPQVIWPKDAAQTKYVFPVKR